MEDKKEALEAAAREVFLKHGYKKTTVSMIAKKAGVAVGSFYNYFDSKEDIFLLVYYKENKKVKNEIIENIDWNEDIELILNNFLNFNDTNFWKNKILQEWTNPGISDKIRGLFLNEESKQEDSLHLILTKKIYEKLLSMGKSQKEIERILKVYDLIYFFDCSVSANQFEGYSETVRDLVTLIARGIE